MLEIGAFLLRTETELVIKSRRVVPQRLLNAGFTFYFPRFEAAVRDLGQPSQQTGSERSPTGPDCRTRPEQ